MHVYGINSFKIIDLSTTYNTSDIMNNINFLLGYLCSDPFCNVAQENIYTVNVKNIALVKMKRLLAIPLIVLAFLFANPNAWGQSSLNSGDFSGGTWGSGQAMSASAGGSLIITKGVTTAGDKYFRFFGDGSPCGEYQPNANGDFFVHNTVVTSPNANCGNSNAWRINVPTVSSNVVFKTDGGNDGIDRSIAFVIQGAVRSISSTSSSIPTPTYLQSPVITAIMGVGTLNTGQGVYLRYSTNNFATSTVVEMSFSSGTSYTASIPAQTTGTVVTYYMFTSGNGLSISGANADFYTINLLNNSGSNYSYTTTGVSRFAVATGNWNETSTWSATSGGSSGASAPIAGDNVTIEGGRTVTVTANASAETLTFSGTSATTLSVNSSTTLTVSGAITLNSNAGLQTACTISGAGTVNCGSITVGSDVSPSASAGTIMTSTISNLTITGSGNLTLRCDVFGSFFNNPRFYLNSGTLTVPGQIIPSSVQNNGGQAVRFWMDQGAQNGTLVLTGPSPWTTNSSFPNGWGNGGSAAWSLILNGTNATVVYNRGGDQTIIPDRLSSTGTVTATYTNLTLAGSGNKNVPTNSSITVDGTLSFEGSATITTKAATFGATSTLQYKNGVRTTTALEWPASSGPRNLIIDNSGNTVTMLGSAARALTGNLTLTAGTLADNGNTLTVNGNILGTAAHSGVGKIVLNTSGSTISGATLGNLELSSAGGNFGLSGSPTINGALTFTNGRLSIGSNTLNLAGTVATMTTSNNITGSSTSNLSITGTGTLGTLFFNQTTLGSTNILNNLTINRSSTGIVNLGSDLNLAGNLTVTNGSLRCSGANTLTMSGTAQSIVISNTSGGSILGTDNSAGNDLTLAIANGSVTTLTGGVSSNDDDKKFFNINVNSGGTLALSRGILCKYGTFSVNGALQINANGYVQSTPSFGVGIAPTYGSSSLLRYNSSSTYGRNFEWSSTSGPGYPNNVQVSNNTTLNVCNGQDVARQMSGNLTIDLGSTLSLEGMTIASPTDIGMTVVGNVINNGSITLATSTERLKCFNFSNNAGATTTLSSNVGGDLELTGSLIDNATFNSNNRAVFFTGSGVQDVSGTGTFNIDYIVSNKASGSIRMLTNLLVEGPNGGNAITLTNSSDILNLNGFALTFGKATVASTISGNGSIVGSSASSISILGTGALGTIRFDQTTPGTTNALGSLTINRTNSGSAVLGNSVVISNALTITNGNVNLGTAIHRAGSLSLGGVTQTTASSYGGTGSPAGTINTTYFAANTGVVNVGSCATYGITSTAVSSPVCSSGAIVSLTSSTTSNLPVGTYTVYYTLTGENTGSFNTLMTVSSAGTGTFITGSLSPGSTTITVDYLRNGCVSAVSGSSATFTVNNVSSAAVISGSTTTCSGNTNNLQVAITGGTSPFTVVYTNGTTNFTVNNYTSGAAIPVSPTTTTTYSLVSVTSTGGCAGTGNSGSAIVSIGTSCTWNGTAWSPSEPTSTSAVEFAGNYTATSNLAFCSVVVTGGIVTIPSGFNITVNGSIIATGGSFVLESNANLIQNTNVSNSGSIIIKRNTSPLMRQDYVMWTSPVSEQQLQSFSPQTLSNRFYTYNPSTNLYVAETATNNFMIGKGYLIRLPNNHPTTPTIWNGQFSGVPNNGNISLSLTSGTYNAIGNPYPSAIDADTFIINNSLTDALYFWRKTNNSTTSSYATYTLAGGVSNSGGDPLGLIPNGFIPVGQGFIAKVPSGGNGLSFTNGMRVGNNSNRFLRSSIFERSRYWLNLTNQNGFFGQIMVAYITGATSGYDPAIDGLYINDSQTALTTLLDNQEYVIQGRALPFLSTDVVALGFKSELAGTYSISLNNFDGTIFETNNQEIYLKDNLTNTIQDLRAGSYTFDTEAGVFNSRFEVSYENLLATDNPSLSSNTLAVYKQDEEIVVNAGKINLSKLEVFDILGRLLVEKLNINGTEVRLNVASTNQVILVKVTSAANEVVTKRIVN
jgi:hypothetical protein